MTRAKGRRVKSDSGPLEELEELERQLKGGKEWSDEDKARLSKIAEDALTELEKAVEQNAASMRRMVELMEKRYGKA